MLYLKGKIEVNKDDVEKLKRLSEFIASPSKEKKGLSRGERKRKKLKARLDAGEEMRALTRLKSDQNKSKRYRRWK